MHKKLLLSIVLLVSIFSVFMQVSAHAVFIESQPPPNSILEVPPEEIRLFFTEPLETEFSFINLRDTSGGLVPLDPSQIDRTDAHQMFVRIPPDIENGVYNVQYRVVSAADGHSTQGQFPITIGVGLTVSAEMLATQEEIPSRDSFIRLINFMGQSLAVGSIGFWLFVWKPAMPTGDQRIEKRLNTVIWLGWVLLGVSGILMLLMQVSITIGAPILETLNGDFIPRIISGTRYGELWLLRTALWVGLGVTLLFNTREKWFLWVALLLSVSIVMTTSLFSHASAAPTDSGAAILADWLHLSATTLWVGGLIQFFFMIGLVRSYIQPAAPILSALIENFSNFARVGIIGLVLSGFYATWLQVNSPEALFTTLYGNLLLLKLAIFVPVMLIAAVNMFVTHRRLHQGSEVWGNRLRGLVGVEVILTIAVLAVVGAMTSISPARGTYEMRVAFEQNQIPPNTYVEAITTTNVTGEMTVEPGYVGNNTFTLALTDRDGNAIEDASRIRLLFRNLAIRGSGESELTMEHQGEGIYTAQGADLSTTGEWRMRVSVAIPSQFDRLYDFEGEFEPAPVLRPATIDPTAPLPNRVPVMLAIGLIALSIGGFFLGAHRLNLRQGSAFVAVGLVVVGIAFLVSSLTNLTV